MKHAPRVPEKAAVEPAKLPVPVLVRRIEFDGAVRIPGLPIAVRQLEAGVPIRPYTQVAPHEAVPCPEMIREDGEIVIGRLRFPLNGGMIRLYELV